MSHCSVWSMIGKRGGVVIQGQQWTVIDDSTVNSKGLQWKVHCKSYKLNAKRIYFKSL